MKNMQAVGAKVLIGGAVLALVAFAVLLPSPARAAAPDCLSGQVGQDGKGKVQNNCSEAYTVGIASYKKTDDTIGNQELFRSKTATVQPGGHVWLSVGVPNCDAQIDLFVGDGPLTPPFYTDLLAAVDVSNGGFCGTGTTPPPPPPITPPPTIQPPQPPTLSGQCTMNGNTPRIGLSWNLVANRTENTLLKNINSGDGFYPQPQPGANDTSYTDTNVSFGNSYSYRIKADGGVSSNMLTLAVSASACGAAIAPPTVNIFANGQHPSVTIQSGTAATLSWTSTNATSCTVNPGGFSGTSGTASTGNLNGSQTYTVTCTGAGGSASDAVTVNVTGGNQCVAPLVTTASATNVTQNSATLNGTVVNNGNLITSAFFEYGTSQNLGSSGLIFTVPANTTRQITNDISNLQPNTTYYFRLVAQDPCGGANVPGAIFSFTTGTGNTVAPTVIIFANGQRGTVTVQYNTSAFISWNSTNANSCVVAPTGWTGAPTGGQNSQNITGSTTFTVTCTGTNNQTATDSVTVVPTGGSGNTPTVTLTANPSSITQGQSSTLYWTSTNATTCYASGGPWSGNKTIGSGSEVVTPPFTSTYTITCTGSNGQTASATATVFVNPTGGGTGSTSITKLVRNVTLNQPAFLQSVEAQGLDTLEFEIRVTNTDSVTRTITVQDILPAELFYISGSTTVDGLTVQDGITTGGVNLGLMNPGQLHIVHFRAMVFFGTSERTVTNQATANGSGFANAYANVVIRNRGGQGGQVLGAADIVTGADDALPIAAAVGFVLAVIFHWFARKRGWYAAGARRIEESKRAIEDVMDDLALRAQKSYAASRPDRFVL